MKNTSKVIRRIAIFAVMAAISFTTMSLIACPTPDSDNDNQTPTAADFIVNGLSQIYDGSPKTVTVTPKQGKSGGKRNRRNHNAKAGQVRRGDNNLLRRLYINPADSRILRRNF